MTIIVYDDYKCELINCIYHLSQFSVCTTLTMSENRIV